MPETTTSDAVILVEYEDRALATWRDDEGRRVIAWVDPEPEMRWARSGIALTPDEERVLLDALLNASGLPVELELCGTLGALPGPGFGVLEAWKCGTCGAVVTAEDRARHRGWHERARGTWGGAQDA